MAYVIKQVPEDFVVKEVFEPELGAGRFACYMLTKRGWTTQSAANMISSAFGKRPKFVNFSGNKDKQAVTMQHISILHGPKKDIELRGGDIRLTYLGQVRDRINLGAAQANAFEITVRNLEPESSPRHVKSVPNYFDEQRFGMNRNNHVVGRHMIRKEFQEACSLVPETRQWLEKSPHDYVGALRSLPKRVLRLYAHSYQSWLWNMAAMSLLENIPHRMVGWPLGELVVPEGDPKNMMVPLIGYESEIPAGLEEIIRGIMEREGITPGDFRARQFSEFDLTGGSRELLVEPSGLETGTLEDDELNKGKKKRVVRFSLKKGSYATMVIRVIFS